MSRVIRWPSLRPPLARRWLAVFVPALLAMLLLGACREEAVDSAVEVRDRPAEGDPRGFMLGFSDIPSDLSDEAYLATYDLAANYGELLLIQRAPAWAEFMGEGRPGEDLRRQLSAEREAARARDLTLLVALDPFDPGNRSRLNQLPATHEGRDLDDPALREAFVNEAVFLARHTQPEYLVLGTDVNVAFERHPAGYEAFVNAYREAYAEVKEVAPATQVMVTFQYEELLGVIPELPPHTPRWGLLADFEDSADLVGITTYPSFAYSVARHVSPRYYLDLAEHTDLPIAFVSAGFASSPGRDGVNSATPAEQQRFLRRLMEDAEVLGSPMVVWFAARDLRFAEAPPYDLIANIGLQDADGDAKEAWLTWERASNRPYNQELAEAARERLPAVLEEMPEDDDAGDDEAEDADAGDDEAEDDPAGADDGEVDDGRAEE